MQITCPKSGIQYTLPHLAGNAQVPHTVFTLPQSTLLHCVSKWKPKEHNAEYTYLLMLALLDSTTLVQWRTHARFTPTSLAASYQNLDYLAQVIQTVGTGLHESLPHYAITPQSCELDNVKVWIDDWVAAHEEYKRGYRATQADEALKRREYMLERMTSAKRIGNRKYATALANWAAIVCNFPSSPCHHALTGKMLPLKEYWKSIIIECVMSDKLVHWADTPMYEDLLVLVEYIQENLTLGSLQSFILLDCMNKASSKVYSYSIVQESFNSAAYKQGTLTPTNVHEVSMVSLLNEAPTTAPVRSEYPSELAFLKAQMKYQMLMNLDKE